MVTFGLEASRLALKDANLTHKAACATFTEVSLFY